MIKTIKSTSKEHIDKVKVILEIIAIVVGGIFLGYKFWFLDIYKPGTFPPFITLNCDVSKTISPKDSAYVYLTIQLKAKNNSKNQKISLLNGGYAVSGITFTDSSDMRNRLFNGADSIEIKSQQCYYSSCFEKNSTLIYSEIMFDKGYYLAEGEEVFQNAVIKVPRIYDAATVVFYANISKEVKKVIDGYEVKSYLHKSKGFINTYVDKNDPGRELNERDFNIFGITSMTRTEIVIH